MLQHARDLPDRTYVFATTCDQMRRAYDEAREDAAGSRFLFNVPVTWQSPTSRLLFAAELERLGRFLERHGGCRPSSATMAPVFREHDRRRSRLRAAAVHWPAREYAQAVAQFHWTGEVKLESFAQTASGNGVPVALIGGPTPAVWTGADTQESGGAPRDPAYAVGTPTIEQIERAGGRVVLDATEVGERSLCPRFPAGDWSGDPLEALVDAYLDQGVDVFQRPNQRLYAWLRERLLARGVRGIVLRTLVACDLWRAEAQTFREAFRLPVLLLDRDEHPGGAAREAGQLQAFLEMLR
jgi:benzoyl-CoA reductase/2-hydroxyglutaryl-CoA dehydratase subunit BcrC/BadD/HgdB